MRLARLEREGAVLIARLRVTESLGERVRGLIGSAPLGDDEAMLLQPCSAIHTVGMSFPIDAVFTDRDGVVVAVHSRIPAMRCTLGGLKAAAVIELAAGGAARLGLREGDVLRVC